jgi:hypothetical protein
MMSWKEKSPIFFLKKYARAYTNQVQFVRLLSQINHSCVKQKYVQDKLCVKSVNIQYLCKNVYTS